MSGQLVMVSNPAVKCDDSSYMALRPFFITMLTVIVCGLPVCLLVVTGYAFLLQQRAEKLQQLLQKYKQRSEKILQLDLFNNYGDAFWSLCARAGLGLCMHARCARWASDCDQVHGRFANGASGFNHIHHWRHGSHARLRGRYVPEHRLHPVLVGLSGIRTAKSSLLHDAAYIFVRMLSLTS